MSPIYESINFDATPVHSKHSHRIQTRKLHRQNAFDDHTQYEPHRKNKIDLESFLKQCIPPPPCELPPHAQSSKDELDPVPEISSGTLEKLNSLYSAYKMHRSISNETEKSDEVVYRLREFHNFKPRTYQDSCKAVWSFVSVRDLHINHKLWNF